MTLLYILMGAIVLVLILGLGFIIARDKRLDAENEEKLQTLNPYEFDKKSRKPKF